ncbi:hypothetical protein T492DRAFT_840166 [Pavlovales sp. CCMP2436]|nr:hypothetical protein T492DRAFT_840166 [Pavlovales sp. CCMP2436]
MPLVAPLLPENVLDEEPWRDSSGGTPREMSEIARMRDGFVSKSRRDESFGSEPRRDKALSSESAFSSEGISLAGELNEPLSGSLRAPGGPGVRDKLTVELSRELAPELGRTPGSGRLDLAPPLGALAHLIGATPGDLAGGEVGGPVYSSCSSGVPAMSPPDRCRTHPRAGPAAAGGQASRGESRGEESRARRVDCRQLEVCVESADSSAEQSRVVECGAEPIERGNGKAWRD